MEQNKLFRKAALEKLTSPERLDVLMEVTSPLGWVALWTMASVIAAIVAWSIFGSISETINGEGILLGGGRHEITATDAGVLENLTLTLNESVEEGQVIGAVTGRAGEGSVSEPQTNQAGQGVEQGRVELGPTSRAVTRAPILASAAGRVIEISKRVGDRVTPGETIARIEPPGAPMEAIVFVDAAAGKRIAVAREAQISPATVKREDFGFMLGTVQSVSDFPVTAERFNSIIANQRLFYDLVGQSSKLEMRTLLIADNRTASGIKWSSLNGPPFKISSGTRVSVRVVVEQHRPISKVLPFVRKTLGIS